MKFYLTQAGVNFIQEGEVKTKNKAKKRKWIKALGTKRAEAGEGGTERTVTASMKAHKHGQEVGAAAVAKGREGRSRYDKSFIGMKSTEHPTGEGAVFQVQQRRRARKKAEAKK